ncbi:hypothetical protein [Clostridium beijerinckii]|uniref:hypothetical protein n=1 Tax=Clostridium beijerinckii TaxID=1520 RepID=UPI00242D69FF|nr:hypothetical protein [Clostridium beijerinckii]MDG5855263.1 hypothetical protein [Clostridium beijerinckii]
MSYESQRRAVHKFIDKCDEVLASKDNNQADKLSGEIIGLFQSIIPNLTSGLDAYDYKYMNGGTPDYLYDVRVLRDRLEFLVETRGVYSSMHQVDKSIKIENGINNSGNSTNNNTNTLNNTVNIKTELSKIRDKIEDDEMLSDEDKEEINQKLNEIENVMDESQTNNEKWRKLKAVVNWVTTKGYKVGEMIIPLITKALFSEEQ